MRDRAYFTGAAAVIVLCTAIAASFAPSKVSGTRERVRAAVPADFPIAVRASGSSVPTIHRYADLAKASQQQGDSFLIGEPLPAGIAIEASSEGKQSLRVEHRIDRKQTAVGWYHATEKEFFPQFYELRTESWDSREMLKYGASAFLITLTLFLLPMWVRRRRIQLTTNSI